MTAARIRVTLCAPADADAYAPVLAASLNPLLHYSPSYLRFLERALPHAQLSVLVAARDGHALGCLPFATVTHETLGTVINSLPFYGSHGGPVVSRDVPEHERSTVKSALLHGFADVARERDAASVTVVESPFGPLTDEDARALGDLEVVDDRIGQVTRLPRASADVEAELFAAFHEKTRNAIRKGQKNNVTVTHAERDDDFRWLHAVHAASIASLGGVVKPLEVFQELRGAFGPAARLYIGSIDGARASGLLVLLYGQTVEYFTPVVEPEQRETQALSALIFDVMCRLAREGFSLWNWGGTWRSQEGVYRFKSRFGAEDRTYRYFNRVRHPALREQPREALAAAFKNFYVFRY